MNTTIRSALATLSLAIGIAGPAAAANLAATPHPERHRSGAKPFPRSYPTSGPRQALLYWHVGSAGNGGFLGALRDAAGTTLSPTPGGQ